MLKKTLLATAAIGATLFAVAAVLPEVNRSGATSSVTSSAPNGQTLASAPAQDRRAAEGDGREERAGAARVGAGAESSVRANDKGAKGHWRGSDRDGSEGSEGKRDHDESDD